MQQRLLPISLNPPDQDGGGKREIGGRASSSSSSPLQELPNPAAASLSPGAEKNFFSSFFRGKL